MTQTLESPYDSARKVVAVVMRELMIAHAGWILFAAVVSAEGEASMNSGFDLSFLRNFGKASLPKGHWVRCQCHC